MFKMRHFMGLLLLGLFLAFGVSPAFAKSKKKKSAFRAACGKEVKRHCKKVKRGKGRLLKCVRKLKKRQKSKRCRSYLAKRKKKRKARLAALGTSKPTKPRTSQSRPRATESRSNTSSSSTSGNAAQGTDSTTNTGSSSENGSSGPVLECNSASSCTRTNDCCPDSSASGARLQVLLEAKKLLDRALASRRSDKCSNEKNLYYPRQCSGFVIDAFFNAGLLSVEQMKHRDWNASYPKKYRHCSGEYVQTAAASSSRTRSAKESNTWRPNMNVTYMRDGYCKTTRGSGYSDADGCAHPWFKMIRESEVKPGDLWVSKTHVGIVFDAKKKIMVHNAVSTGPTMDNWDSGYYKNNQTNIIFLRHHSL